MDLSVCAQYHLFEKVEDVPYMCQDCMVKYQHIDEIRQYYDVIRIREVLWRHNRPQTVWWRHDRPQMVWWRYIKVHGEAATTLPLFGAIHKVTGKCHKFVHFNWILFVFNRQVMLSIYY